MPDALQSAKNFRDLLGEAPDGGPYAYSQIFSDEGVRARALSKKKFKLLKRIDPKLRPMLHEGEQVFFLTQGSAVSFWESYFLGWAMYYINRRAIVLTNERIIFIQITSRGKPRDLRSQIRYPAITKVRRTVLGNTKMLFRNGKSQVFVYIPRRDRKFLKALVERTSGEMPTAEPDAQATEELCPHCYEPVVGRPLQCPQCNGAFKSARKAAALSLLFPGLGDIYIGHWKFAVFEILFAGIIWLSVLAVAIDPTVSAGEVITIAVYIVVILHGMDSLATWYIARKGIHPA